MSLQNQVRAWLIILAVAILALWIFRGILLPFVVGMALAYLLDPIADKLETWKFSRFWATAVIMILAIVLFVGAFFLVVPLLVQQLAGLAQRLPGYVGELQELANQWSPAIYDFIGAERASQVQTALADMLQNGLGIAGNIIGQLMQSSLAIVNVVGLLVITPVVAFYLLLDWDNMVASVDRLLPRKHLDEIRSVFKEMDLAMAGVIRGQFLVVVTLAAFYGIALTVAGLNFGLAIGLTAGFLSFIPYVGFLVGFLLSIGVAIVQFWPDWIMVGVIFVIFIFGQFLEGNVLYPKLVGSSIGVHPVWLMFALFAFGLIFGTVGLLLAVPLVAITNVMIRFGVRKYQESPLYQGAEESNGGRTKSTE